MASAQVFKYEKPELERAVSIVRLSRTDVHYGQVQVWKEGGENNVHSHSGQDGFWFVLNGRAQFYGDGDVLLGDLGRHEGVVIPRGFKYWFKNAGIEPLELLHIGAIAQSVKDERTDYTPETVTGDDVKYFEASRTI